MSNIGTLQHYLKKIDLIALSDSDKSLVINYLSNNIESFKVDLKAMFIDLKVNNFQVVDTILSTVQTNLAEAIKNNNSRLYNSSIQQLAVICDSYNIFSNKVKGLTEISLNKLPLVGVFKVKHLLRSYTENVSIKLSLGFANE